MVLSYCDRLSRNFSLVPTWVRDVQHQSQLPYFLDTVALCITLVILKIMLATKSRRQSLWEEFQCGIMPLYVVLVGVWKSGWVLHLRCGSFYISIILLLLKSLWCVESIATHCWWWWSSPTILKMCNLVYLWLDWSMSCTSILGTWDFLVDWSWKCRGILGGYARSMQVIFHCIPQCRIHMRHTMVLMLVQWRRCFLLALILM